MVGSISCGILAVLLSFLMGISLLIAMPGLIIGAFFAFRYAMYDKTKATKEQQGRDRKTKRRRLSR
jgi:hypothetical protein